jgi:microcystin-dependent protein
MAIDFPNSPVTNDTYVVGDRKWVYDGEKWALVSASPELLVVSPTAPTNTNVIWADTTVAGTMNSLIPSGAMMPFAGATSPTGWLLCYGQTLVRATYPDLFAVVGTTYNTGGEAGTDFRLPDLRGRTVAGQDDMGGTSANRLTGQTNGVDGDALGGTGGSETHTLTTAQMPSHTHTQNAHSHSGNTSMNAYTDFLRLVGVVGTTMENNHSVGRGGGSFADYAGAYPNHQHSLSIDSSTAINQSTGGDGAHNIVQPTIILNYIIKT